MITKNHKKSKTFVKYIMSQGDFVSYTWPNLIYQVKELAKEGYPKINQLVIVVLSFMIYSVILLYVFQSM